MNDQCWYKSPGRTSGASDQFNPIGHFGGIWPTSAWLGDRPALVHDSGPSIDWFWMLSFLYHRTYTLVHLNAIDMTSWDVRWCPACLACLLPARLPAACCLPFAAVHLLLYTRRSFILYMDLHERIRSFSFYQIFLYIFLPNLCTSWVHLFARTAHDMSMAFLNVGMDKSGSDLQSYRSAAICRLLLPCCRYRAGAVHCWWLIYGDKIYMYIENLTLALGGYIDRSMVLSSAPGSMSVFHSFCTSSYIYVLVHQSTLLMPVHRHWSNGVVYFQSSW